MTPNPAQTLSPEVLRRRARRTLTLIFIVCVAPVVLGTLVFYFWTPSGRTNYGELLPLAELRPAGRTPEGNMPDPAALAGKWVLVTYDRGACGEACEKKLYYTRQIRSAQGREQERVARLWIRSSPVPVRGEIGPLLAGLLVVHDVDDNPPAALVGDAEKHIYLMDPFGNVMLRFPTDPEPKRIIRDLQKLLRVNSWSK